VKLVIFTLGIFLVAVGLAGYSWATKPTRYRIDLPLTVKGQETHKPLMLPAKKGYSYEVSEQLTDIAILRVFNSEGQALDGYYEITIEELHQLLKQKINAGLKATSGSAVSSKCASCQVGEASKDRPEGFSDRRPAVERPVPVPLENAVPLKR
jgi:hypothetical protein